MVIPSEKATALERFCLEKGLTTGGLPETMFVHFAEDTPVRLHVGAERAENPIEERVVPGWDAANDRNRDGRVDEREFADRPNRKAGARAMSQARVPMYYWGPPRDDYTMNVADPAYQEFIATRYAAEALGHTDGLFIDTTSACVPGAAGRPLVEFSTAAQADGAWRRALQMALAGIKIAHPDAVVTANGWQADPFVIDGTEWENWLRITDSESKTLTALQDVIALDRRGKLQMVQYNPIYEPKYAEFGPRAPIDQDRDRLYGLAAYYLCQGAHTYMGRGGHPYTTSERQWFPALARDLGAPRAQMRAWATGGAQTAVPDLLGNGGFETVADDKPAGWEVALPLAMDGEVRHGGRYSVRIDSTSSLINNINKAWLDLRPNTTYTLSGWIRTEGVGGDGAQVYPYGFEGMTSGGFIIARGTTDWRRYSVAFTTGTGTHGRVNFRLYNTTGRAWFDDLSLRAGVDGPWTVYGREYENGLVLLRPFAGAWDDDKAAVVALPGPFRPLGADNTLGAPAREVRLRSGEAAVLVR